MIRTVRTCHTRVSAILLTLALSLGDIALCAGWQATPEARMACCTSGVACPMHKAASTSADTSHAALSHTVTQADADRCCASSERSEGGPSAQFSPSSPTVAIVPITLDAIETAPSILRGRPQTPPPLAHSVARHVLLSVFLV